MGHQIIITATRPNINVAFPGVEIVGSYFLENWINKNKCIQTITPSEDDLTITIIREFAKLAHLSEFMSDNGIKASADLFFNYCKDNNIVTTTAGPNFKFKT